jgi:hypothetical protein
MIAGCVVWVGEARNSCKILIGNLYEKKNSMKNQDGKRRMMIKCILKKYVLVFRTSKI